MQVTWQDLHLDEDKKRDMVIELINIPFHQVIDLGRALTYTADLSPPRTVEISRDRLPNMLHLLNQIRNLVVARSSQTLRGLYYSNKERFSSQRLVNEYVKEIVSMLKLPIFDLGITVETKGKVQGGLTFFSQEKD